ncbi:MAG: exonuclease domain-containing protein [Clostridia bacterium]|nr:exonuclease domain-containing protein [Clostridia bacterium]
MRFIVLDLEWNGSYSKKAHGYFNEIIEIGAVALDDEMHPVDAFHRVIRPSVSKKLTNLVKELTHITPEELEEEGGSFAKTMRAFSKWAGEEAAVLTWSNTDLLVLLENYRFFHGIDRIPFMKWYADIQPYCQRRMGVDTSQQMGLSRACEALAISAEDSALHRAPDDAMLTAQVFMRLYDPESFAACLQQVNKEFYARLLFKPIFIREFDSPLIKRGSFCFSCPECGKGLQLKGKWKYFSRAFCAELFCKSCKKAYMARVQCRQLYEGVDIRRKLTEKKPSQPEKTDVPET